MRLVREIGLPLAGLLLFTAIAWLTLGEGLSSLRELRQLERTPPSLIGAMLPGEVQTTGWVEADKVLTSPLQKLPCVYYRHLHEEYVTDSDGDSHWRLRDERSGAVNFRLRDHTGEISLQVRGSEPDISWDAGNYKQEERGDERYTEWCILEGDKLFTFAYATPRADGLQLSFSHPGAYTPIISHLDASQHQSRFGTTSVFIIWGGLSLVGLAVWCLAIALRIHLVWQFLSLLSSVTLMLMLYFSLNMLRADMAEGAARLEEQLALVDTMFAQVSEGTEAENQSRARVTLAASQQRLEDQFARFPERVLAAWWKIELPPDSLALSLREMEMLDSRDMAAIDTRLNNTLVNITIGLALALALFLAWLAFRRITQKRMMENIATQKTRGIVPGVAELTGNSEAHPEREPLRGPISGAACCWYDYKVEERRRVGKKKTWVTIEHSKESRPFFCVDDEGQLLIDPNDAEIITEHQQVRREGRLRYTERSLLLDTSLYALGPVVIDRDDPSRILMRQEEAADRYPFILSDLGERAVMLLKARHGMLALSLSMSSLILFGMIAFASAGSFSPYDFARAGLLAPGFMLLIMVVFHYNDLLFLRLRAHRNWSNIEVALKKRSNLIPSWERIVQEYLRHESGLQEELARLREQIEAGVKNQTEAASYLENENQLLNSIRGRIVAYPNLKGDQVVSKLFASINDLESEIALLRAGYNDAVTQYNTRIDTFPDLLLARPFGFEPMSRMAL